MIYLRKSLRNLCHLRVCKHSKLQGVILHVGDLVRVLFLKSRLLVKHKHALCSDQPIWLADIYTFGLDGVYTFDWKYGLSFSWKWFDIFNQMACFTGYIICVDVWSWYDFVTLQILTSEIFETCWRKFCSWQNFPQSTCTQFKAAA